MTTSETQQGMTPGRVALATLIVVGVAVGFYLLFRFHMVVFILFVAIVLGTAIKPGVEWLHQRGIARALGVILIYLTLLAALVGVLLVAVPPITAQVTTIQSKLPEYYGSLRDYMANSPSRLVSRLAAELPFAPPPLEGDEEQSPEDAASAAVQQALNIGESITEGIFLMLTILLLAFYWNLDGERTIRGLLLLAPMERRKPIRDGWDEIELKLGSFIRGQAFLCLVVGLLSTAAYLLIGLPYALTLGLIAGILEAVPILGPVLGAIPAMIIAITSETPGDALWVVAASVVIQQLENNLLVPRVMDRAVGVNAIMSLLALAAFGSLLGIAGALMAIPLAAVVQVLINRSVLKPQEQLMPAGRDKLSMLRYETQQIVQDVRKMVRHKPEAEQIDLRDGELPAKAEDQITDLVEVIANDLDRLLGQAVEQKEAQP